MIKILLTLFSLASIPTLADGNYARLWRGEAKTQYKSLKDHCDDKTNDCFLEFVNQWIIPATPSHTAEKALLSYTPVLLPKNLQSNFHDSIALNIYSSEKDYNKLRSDQNSIEAKTYGPIHADVFELGILGSKKSSRIIIPIPYQNKITLIGNLKEVSYDIIGKKNELISSAGFFKIIERKEQNKNEYIKNINNYLTKIKETKTTKAAYSLITEEHTMIYIFNEKDIMPENLLITWSTKLKKLQRRQSSPLLYEKINYGEGGNIQFKIGEKPGSVDHYRLHL